MHTLIKNLSLQLLIFVSTIGFTSIGFAQTYPQRISTATDGSQSNGASRPTSMSDDGRHVVIMSDASNLVPGDSNRVNDVFVYDRNDLTIERVSVASDGGQANAYSGQGVISADGRYVVFPSSASNLVPNDTNGKTDIFLHDRVTRITTRISVAPNGEQSNGDSSLPVVTPDARYVAFGSSATNLIANDTNGRSDAFVRDMITGVIERVSIASDGSEGNGGSGAVYAISADGRYVVFNSAAWNFVPGDLRMQKDLYRHDRETGETELVNVTADGIRGNDSSYDADISADGRYVTFPSDATNLVPNHTNRGDIYVHDFQSGVTELISSAHDGAEANSRSFHPKLSKNGRYIVFDSWSSNLVPNDTNYDAIGGGSDVFVYNRAEKNINRISIAGGGAEGNGRSDTSIISANGEYIAFSSLADNLVLGDTNASSSCPECGLDVFVALSPSFEEENNPPVLAPIGDQQVDEGQTLTFTLAASDPDGDALTYSVANLPVGATFDPQTATFTWTPSYGQAGNYPNVEFTVTDSGSPMALDVELITITVAHVNRAPIFAPIEPQSVLENNTLTFTVSATDPDNDAVVIGASDLPAGATFNAQTGVFSWTPTLSQSGDYVVTFTATDSGTPILTNTLTVPITVGDNPTPEERADTLVDTVISYDLPTNIENSYLANLKKVEKFITEGKIQPAINQLNAFITKLNADYAAGQITQTVHDALLAQAQSLLAVLQ